MSPPLHTPHTTHHTPHTTHLRACARAHQLVLSTDKLSDARHPVLLLTLGIIQADGARREEVVELGAVALDSLLSDFGRAAETIRRIR